MPTPVCQFCGWRLTSYGHQLCGVCRGRHDATLAIRARLAVPAKRGGRRPGQNPNPAQRRDQYGRFFFPGETPERIRIDYPGETT